MKAPSALALACTLACSSEAPGPFLTDARIVVPGVGVTNTDCRAAICRHNENTDLISWKGAIWFVHRTAMSQVLGMNSALHVYRTVDGGRSWTDLATLLAPDETQAPPDGRDLRDPHFFVVGDELWLKALTRLPVTSVRDSNVETRPVVSRSKDGSHWSPLEFTGEKTFSLWSIKRVGDTLYSAAYEDGDTSVWLFSSTDGATWTRGARIYGVAGDTPLETDLVPLDLLPAAMRPGAPAGTLAALVRMDGTDEELLGTRGRLRTRVCHAAPPYDAWQCPHELTGERLDGPVSFVWKDRLFVVARRHLQGPRGQKRTALFELRGALGPGAAAAPRVVVHGDFPSAGDTAYAGVAPLDPEAGRYLVTWYSSDVAADEHWFTAMLGPTDIWQGTLDLSKLPP